MNHAKSWLNSQVPGCDRANSVGVGARLSPYSEKIDDCDSGPEESSRQALGQVNS